MIMDFNADKLMKKFRKGTMTSGMTLAALGIYYSVRGETPDAARLTGLGLGMILAAVTPRAWAWWRR